MLCAFASVFFNDTTTTEIYTLSLHDALPICVPNLSVLDGWWPEGYDPEVGWAIDGVSDEADLQDRKSTRLNSSHSSISYAVFCLKKKNLTQISLIHHSSHTPTFRSSLILDIT